MNDKLIDAFFHLSFFTMRTFKIILTCLLLAVAPFSEIQAQSTFNTCIEEGIKRYKNGRWDEAIKLFRAAAADTGTSADGKSKANQWIEKCMSAKKRASMAVYEKFIPSIPEVNVLSEGCELDVSIEAGSPWEVLCYPEEWCEVVGDEEGIHISVRENPTLESRSGEIIFRSNIRIGNSKPYSVQNVIPITQNGRSERVVSFTFNTEPGNALIIMSFPSFCTINSPVS